MEEQDFHFTSKVDSNIFYIEIQAAKRDERERERWKKEEKGVRHSSHEGKQL